MEDPVELPVLVPLVFQDSIENFQADGNDRLPCIICEEKFEVVHAKGLIEHLLSSHSVVIEDFENISLVPKYLKFWKQELKCKDYTHLLTEDSHKKIYILNKNIKSDEKLRMQLLNERIQEIFDMQTSEWSNGQFIKNCFFCAKTVFTNQSDFIKHLNEFHHFMLGSQHNFVNLKEFLNIIEEKLKKLQCLYCERFFKDYPAFKEHIRKKHHKRIKSSNPLYHHFFFDKHPELNKLKNLGCGEDNEDEEDEEKEVCEIEGKKDSTGDVNEHDDVLVSVPIEQRIFNNERKMEFCDWTEENAALCVCLYCSFSCTQYPSVMHHMKVTHNFDLEKVQESLHFYQCVKLINYIRRQIYHNTCPVCFEKSPNADSLQNHLKSSEHHSVLPSMHVFDKFQYFFPTYEEDPLLTYIHNAHSDDFVNSTTETQTSPSLNESCLQTLSLKDN